jgi:hypothetical protein
MAPKVKWADMTDDDDWADLPQPIATTRHGVKIVKRPKTPPPPDKTKTGSSIKSDARDM